MTPIDIELLAARLTTRTRLMKERRDLATSTRAVIRILEAARLSNETRRPL